MNVFDIIGPVMIGPSSSHTAGAVRLGRVANKLMDGKTPSRVEITLSGSFARTYRGHGTDRALLAGIMGWHSYSEEIRDALEIASERGIRYEFIKKDIPGAHPNTARIFFELPDGTSGSVQGASVGGGNIRVDLVNGMKVDRRHRRGDQPDAGEVCRAEYLQLPSLPGGEGRTGNYDHRDGQSPSGHDDRGYPRTGKRDQRTADPSAVTRMKGDRIC